MLEFEQFRELSLRPYVKEGVEPFSGRKQFDRNAPKVRRCKLTDETR
jgi:hypothetical protein